MTTAHGPIFGRRRLRLALRKAREASGFRQDQVAGHMDWSASKLTRIEAGQVSVSTNDLKALLALYGVTDDARVRQMLELGRISRQRAWWSTYRDRLSNEFYAYLGLEAEASAMRAYQPLLVPGLLHTPAYARALIAETSPFHLAPDDVDDRVSLRMTRQREVLDQADPPSVIVVLDEAVIRRPVGGSAAMREQLLHLIASIERANLTIEILPFTAGPYPAMYAPFVILEFPDDEDAPVVYMENAFTVDIVLERPDEIELYHQAFDKMRELSLSAKDSVRLLKKAAEEFA